MAKAKATAAKAKTSGQKQVLLHIGGPYHDGPGAAKALAETFDRNGGRYALTVTDDVQALAGDLSPYDAVMVYSMGTDKLPDAAEKNLVQYVEGGGALVGLHHAACQFPQSKAWVKLLGGQFAHHPPMMQFPVKVRDIANAATLRLTDFEIFDELYVTKNRAADIDVLATTRFEGEDMPLIWTRTQGSGRVYYNALGHSPAQLRDPLVAKSIRRGLDWACGVEPPAKAIRCAMLGYGGAFNMGKRHSEDINAVPGMTAVAACDIDPARMAQAKAEFPAFRTYTNPDDLLADDEVDLVVIILPHDLHAAFAIQCLEAGKHVVLEKPFCLTLAEADAMIDAARRNKRMLTCYHNRRWDGDYMTIRRIIERGEIGEVFSIACGFAGYNRPRDWWRSSKAVSGGTMYDWGAHFTDWVLGLVPRKIVSVDGYFQKKVWHHVTNEDHTQAIVRFEGGVMADIVFSSISAAGRPRWKILGTKGAILDDGSVEKGCKVTVWRDGGLVEQHVKWGPSRWEQYYVNLADHLLAGDELVVRPEQARRVIGVIEAAEKASAQGSPVAIPGE